MEMLIPATLACRRLPLRDPGQQNVAINEGLRCGPGFALDRHFGDRNRGRREPRQPFGQRRRIFRVEHLQEVGARKRGAGQLDPLDPIHGWARLKRQVFGCRLPKSGQRRAGEREKRRRGEPDGADMKEEPFAAPIEPLDARFRQPGLGADRRKAEALDPRSRLRRRLPEQEPVSRLDRNDDEDA